jgi:hypothetical protein
VEGIEFVAAEKENQLPLHLNFIVMADDKKNVGKQDDIRVDSQDPSEVEYLHQQFPSKTHQEIKDAIKKAGPMRNEVIKYLNGH